MWPGRLGGDFHWSLGLCWQIKSILSIFTNSNCYGRFHGRGCHLVGRAKNLDRLGRVIVSVQNGGERIQVQRLFAL